MLPLSWALTWSLTCRHKLHYHLSHANWGMADRVYLKSQLCFIGSSYRKQCVTKDSEVIARLVGQSLCFTHDLWRGHRRGRQPSCFRFGIFLLLKKLKRVLVMYVWKNHQAQHFLFWWVTMSLSVDLICFMELNLSEDMMSMVGIFPVWPYKNSQQNNNILKEDTHREL